MLRRALIAVILIVVAIASNGSRRATASDFWPQQTRPIPSIPQSVDTSADPEEQPGEEIREEFHQTYPLSLTGRVSVENLNGGVQIKVWDRAAVQVDAVKRAYKKERLAQARIDVNSSEENIRIKTEYPDENQSFRNDWRRHDNPATVDYTLTVPRKAALDSVELVNGSLEIDGSEALVKASSINGPVAARGLIGEAKLSTINGPLHAVFTQLNPTNAISLGSVNGPVTLVIPSDSNATVSAGTVHGGISNDFGLKVKHGQYVGHSLDGQIGTGGPKIKLGNVNGPIRISRAQDGRPLSPVVSVAVDVSNEVGEVGEVDVPDVRVRIDGERIARQTRQQINSAIREAERAQRQVQIQKVRVNSGKGTGAGTGGGVGKGSGGGVSKGSGGGTGVGVGTGTGRSVGQDSKIFSVSGSPRVTVCTFSGTITVRGWDKPEVLYNAIKRADSDEELKQIWVSSDQKGAEVGILADAKGERNGSVHLEVFVPRNATLYLTTDEGQVVLEGVKGDLSLRSGDGEINVSNGGGVLRAFTGDGPIRVWHFDGEVEARTGEGAITLDGNFNSLAARTGDGAISLSVPSGSNFTVETNANDDVSNEGLNVTQDVTPTRRVRRWKVGNGGRVFILKTGDGKILLRSR